MLNSTQLSSFGNGGCFSTAKHLFAVFWKMCELNQPSTVAYVIFKLLCPIWNVDRHTTGKKGQQKRPALIRLHKEKGKPLTKSSLLPAEMWESLNSPLGGLIL